MRCVTFQMALIGSSIGALLTQMFFEIPIDVNMDPF